MRNRLFDRILVVAYVIAAALPLVAMTLGIGERALSGVVAPARRPRLGRTFLTEQYQQRFTAWFDQHVGFKATAVSLDNTILYHVFGETKPGSQVVLGDDGVLFESGDLAYYNKQAVHLPSPAYVDRIADQIAAAQQRLRARGRALVPVIVPAKTSIWRDRVPAAWRRDLGEPRPSDLRVYQAIVQALDRRGVTYLDMRAKLAAFEPREAVFGADGRHWTGYGACLAVEEVSARYAALTGKPRPPHACPRTTAAGDVELSDDFDLLRLLNAFGVAPAAREVTEVRHGRPAPGPRPSVVFVGTSFCWQLIRDADQSGAFGALHLDYYHQSLMALSEDASVAIGTPAARAILMNKDLYVLDLFEGFLLAPGAYVELFLADFER